MTLPLVFTWGHSCGCDQMMATATTSEVASGALWGMTGKLCSNGRIRWLGLFISL